MKTLTRAADLTHIRERFLALTSQDQRLWGTMSPGEMVCHVRDAYEGPLGLRVLAPSTDKLPMPRGLLKRVALYLPAKWPPGIKTLPEVDQRLGGTPPVDLTRDRDALLVLLAQFSSATQLILPHPIFGPMSHRDWMRWGYLHADHHLRQFGR
jgi:hypothetical protein